MSSERRGPDRLSRQAAEAGVARGPASQLALALLLVSAAVLVTHWPVLQSNALWLDDHEYVVENPLVKQPGWNSTEQFLTEVFKPSTVSGYYQPLTMISLMLDYAGGGQDGSLRPYHRTNLVLHTLNTVLVTIFLYVLFGRPWVAAMLGLLFGCHPMTVETMAWLVERKTLLATFFALGCLVLYVPYARRRRWKLYVACLVMFVLALLCKPTTTPLPALLLLLDYWPLRRLSVRTAIEKVPFFIVAGLSAAITYVSQAQAGVVTLPQQHSPLTIPLTLCHNIVFYPWKMVWPTQLTSHHTFPEPFNLSQPMVLAGVIGTALLIPILLISWRWTRAALVGWLFFFVAIFPTMGVIGFTNIIAGYKYAYLPAVGFLMILAPLLGRLWEARPRAGRPARWRAVMLLAVVLLAGLEARAARGYLVHWANTESLYRYFLTLSPNSATLYNNLGTQLVREGRDDEAVQLFLQALAVNPAWHSAHNNLGNIWLNQGKLAQAKQHFEQALRLKPDYWKAEMNLGVALMCQGQLEAGRQHLERSVEIKPSDVQARCNLAAVLIRLGRFEQAAEHCSVALRRDANSHEAHHNLAVALAQMGDVALAERHMREAIRLRPDYVQAQRGLGELMLMQGRIAEAVGVYESALRIVPGDAKLLADLQRARTRLDAANPP